MYNVGDTLTFTPKKGGVLLAPETLSVTSTTTVQNMMDFMTGAMGLVPDTVSNGVPVDADGIHVGISITGGGAIQIKGNRGTVNDIALPSGSFTTAGGTIPINFTAGAIADGESTSTNFVGYDSLGQPIDLTVTSVLESRSAHSTTFRYFVTSPDNSSSNIVLGTSTVTFNDSGREELSPNNTFTIDRSSDSAVSPQAITIDWSRVSGISTAAAGSNLSLVSQDGSPPGTLTSYVIDKQGLISGVFDNGTNRTLGQVVLAQFNNPQGLIQAGNNTFSAGGASGLPLINKPGTLGAGTIQAGAVELSNTDVSKNLVNLIEAASNYQANARVISSVDTLLQSLLQIGR